MKNLKLFAIALISVFVISCQDEFTDNADFEESPLIQKRNSGSNNATQRGTNSKTEKTVLGDIRENPFSVTNVNSAKVILYGSSTPLVTATHKYVKFSPTTQDHIADLDLWETVNQIPIFDFPLEYEIITAGEYYHDDEVEDPLYTYQYSSIPVNTDFPVNVPFEIIDDIYLDYSDPLLLAQSFQMTENGDEINEHFNGGDGINPDDLDNDVLGTIPLPPECPEGTYPLLFINDNTSPVTYLWVCVPEETDDGSSGGNNGGNNGPSLNECGCPVPSNIKNPAGCIQVDRDGVNVGVTSVTVKTKDNWFTSDFATTDENGCWRIDEEYGGNMWMWVVFKNSACEIRDIGHFIGLRVLKDYVGTFNSPFNNTYVPYSDGTTDIITNEERMFWAGAHSINTTVDYRGRVVNDGIMTPRSHLNILNFAGDGAAAAPMLQGNPFNSAPALIILFIPVVNLINFLTTSLQPDIINRYGDSEPAFSVNATLYHELGHASHHQAVGEGYWYWYRNHIILNLGYGSFGSFHPWSHPGKVALGEAFGSFAANRYGDALVGGDAVSFDLPGSTSPENFIPRGLMFDLMDNTMDIIVDPNDASTSVDNVTGFTPAMIFSAMNQSDINTIRKFRDRLRTLHLSDTPNTTTAYNTFVDQYDVFN